MGKIVYRTKSPRKGYVGYESNSTHVDTKWPNKYPSKEVESEGLKIVNEVMYDLISRMKKLGYDETKVSFNMTFKD